MDNQKLKEKFQFRIAISEIQNELLSNQNKSNVFIMKNSIIAASACLALTTGVVFAKDIESFIKTKFGLSLGIQTAVDNGYISTPETDYIFCNTKITDNSKKHIDNANIGLKVNSFLLDNSNLSLEFSIKFDDKVKNIIDTNNIHNIQLSNITITDEENKKIYSSDINENYLNTGLNNFSSNYDSSTNSIKLTYNIYLENENFPKSKKLYISSQNVNIETLDNNLVSNKITLSGVWNLELEVPKIMHSSQNSEYRVTKCDNKDFEIYSAKLTDTGFELGITVSNIEKPKYPQELYDQEKEIYQTSGNIINEDTQEKNSDTKLIPSSIVSSDSVSDYYENNPNKKIYEEFYKKQFPIGNISENYIHWASKTEGNYILNSNGEKFFISNSLGGKASYKFIDENKYNYCDTFDMTKYNATDKITAVIYLYGSPVKIELEKIK